MNNAGPTHLRKQFCDLKSKSDRRHPEVLDKNPTFKTSHTIYKYRFLFDQPKGLIYRYIIHSIPLPELDQLLLDSFRSISKQDL